MALALLYNLTGDKAAKVRFALFKLGITPRPVAPEEYALPLGTLAGIPDLPVPEAEEALPIGEMLVLYQVSDAQLDGLLAALRQARATVALKAVVTETNAGWSSARLYRELSAEHAAMAGASARKAPQRALHKKK